MSSQPSLSYVNRKLFTTPAFWRAAWISLYTVVVTIALYAGFSHWAYDDPFITYRYAHNLANGLGFVYNPGERVLSTTTPFFALLLALLSALWADLPRLANLIGALSLALGGLSLWDLARSWKTPNAGWTALLLYPAFPLLITTLGSETPLYLAFCLAAFTYYARQRYHWAAVFSALAVLTRPDGALVPVLLGIDYLLRVRRPVPWMAIFLFLGLTLPWFVFAWSYFGSPLPATLAAKQHQGAMAISQRFAPGFLALARLYAASWYYWLAAALALVGILYCICRARRWMLFFAWTVLYFTAYSLLGVSRYYWYYAPLVPGIIAMVGLGVEGIRNLGSGTRDQGLATRRPRSAISDQLSAVFSVALASALLLGQGSDILKLRTQTDPRAQLYREVGEWLRANIPSGDSVATLEVGIIGYYAQRPMIDFAGLIQPEVAAQLTPQATYADAANWAVENYRPDYLVLQEGSFPAVEQVYAALHCRVVERFPGDRYGYMLNLDVYACGQ